MSKVYDNCLNVDLLAIKLANLCLYIGQSNEKLTIYIARINDANILSLYSKKKICYRKLWIAWFYIYIYNICSIVYSFYIQGEQSTVLKIIPYTKCGDNSLYKNKLKCRIKFFRLRLCVRGNQVWKSWVYVHLMEIRSLCEKTLYI